MKKHLRDWRATAVTISTLCFVVSGCQDASSPAANVLVASSSTAKQEFPDDGVSIASNSWRALPSLVTPRLGHAAVSLGGCVWAIGGRGGVSIHSSVERYCPSIDATRWSAAAPLPEARTDFAGVGVIATRIYAAGGRDASGGARRSLFVYSAATGWSVSSDSLPFPMACGGGGAVYGRLRCLGKTSSTARRPRLRRRACHQFESGCSHDNTRSPWAGIVSSPPIPRPGRHPFPPPGKSSTRQTGSAPGTGLFCSP